jgi:hypothetical protein
MDLLAPMSDVGRGLRADMIGVLLLVRIIPTANP